MYSPEQIKNFLFIDVETVTAYPDFETMQLEAPALAEHWVEKCKLITSRTGKPELADHNPAQLFQLEAALYTEFSKIVTISIGQVTFQDNTPQFKVKSYNSDISEGAILTDFNKALFALFNRNPNMKLVGHNITGFDLPLILRKFIQWDLSIPKQLHLHTIKPWESCLVDTSAIWKFGSWTGCSLDLLCLTLGIPSPKTDLKGARVSEVYWAGHSPIANSQLARISQYCEADVKAVANVILKMAQLPLCL
jgi:predicted PolB exonuclease-like 3'-5' exonuclease